MTPQTTNLLLPDQLDDAGDRLDGTDRDALRAIVDWIDGFVTKPHADLGRAGPVCPFVPGSLERQALFLAPERIADLDTPQVVELMDDYKRLLLGMPPTGDDDAMYTTIIVVFTDLAAERAGALFGEVQDQLAASSYEEDGVIFGPFYEGNEGTAIYNSSFRPFQPPVPFLFVRHTVLSDWKFFVDDPELLDRWARRFGPAGTAFLAKELRRVPWRDATRGG